VLVVNAGSSSLKVRLLDPADQVVASLDLGQWPSAGETETLEQFVTGLPHVDAVGHRIMHGGATFHAPAIFAEGMRDRIAGLSELAPLREPRAVAGIDAMNRVLPDTLTAALTASGVSSTARPPRSGCLTRSLRVQIQAFSGDRFLPGHAFPVRSWPTRRWPGRAVPRECEAC